MAHEEFPYFKGETAAASITGDGWQAEVTDRRVWWLRSEAPNSRLWNKWGGRESSRLKMIPLDRVDSFTVEEREATAFMVLAFVMGVLGAAVLFSRDAAPVFAVLLWTLGGGFYVAWRKSRQAIGQIYSISGKTTITIPVATGDQDELLAFFNEACSSLGGLTERVTA